MSTALEVMQAIVDNGGPKEKNGREVCPNCGKKAWKIAINVRNESSCIACEKCSQLWPESTTKPKTRPMTPREFAKFVGENMGRYLYSSNNCPSEFWFFAPSIIDQFTVVENWLYAHNTKGELVWQELPQMEVE